MMNQNIKNHRLFWLFLVATALSSNWNQKTTVGQELIDLTHFTRDSITEVKFFLTEVWSRDANARRRAEERFADLSEPARAIVLAYVANRLHDSQPREALAAMNRAIDRDPQFLDGLLIRAHLNLRLRNFDQALVDLRSAVRLSGSIELNDDLKEIMFYRIGRMIGFLEGPVSHRANQDLLNSLSNEVPNFANDQQIAEMKRGINEVLEIFAELIQQVDQRFEQELETQAQINVNLEQTLTQENQNLQQASALLTDQIDQVRNAAIQREAQLSAQFAPIESNLYSLERQMATARIDLSFLYTELAFAQTAPIICPITLQLLRDRIRLAELNLFSIRNSYAMASNQLAGLQAQLQQLQFQTQQQIQGLNQELRQASVRMNRNQRQLARIAGGPEIEPRKREAILNRSDALSTYVTLTPSAIRQDLLDYILELAKNQ